MKVVLLQDNKKLGKKGDIVKVSDGFAFNNLIPQGIARAATDQVIAENKQQEARQEKATENLKVELQKTASQLDKKKVTVLAQAKEEKLFGSVTAKEISAAISEQHNVDVDEKNIKLTAPIKELTTCEVMIDYGHNVTAGVIVTVAAK